MFLKRRTWCVNDKRGIWTVNRIVQNRFQSTVLIPSSVACSSSNRLHTRRHVTKDFCLKILMSRILKVKLLSQQFLFNVWLCSFIRNKTRTARTNWEKRIVSSYVVNCRDNILKKLIVESHNHTDVSYASTYIFRSDQQLQNVNVHKYVQWVTLITEKLYSYNRIGYNACWKFMPEEKKRKWYIYKIDVN